MRSVVVVAGARVVTALLQTVILILLARSSGLSEFGRFSVGYSIGGVIASVLNLGLPGFALRDAGEGSAERAPFLRGAGTALAVVAAAIAFGVAMVLQLLSPGHAPAGIAGVAVAGAAASNVLSDAVSNINQTSLYSQGRVGRAVAVQFIVRIIPTAAVVGSALAGADPFSVLAVAYLVSAVVGSVTSGRLRLHLRRSAESVRASVQYWRESLWALVQQLDVTTVSLLVGERAAGAYAAGFRLAGPIHIVTSSVSAIYVPRLSRETDLGRRRSDATTMLRWGLLYTAALVVLSPLAAWLGPLLLGPQFAPTAYLFPVFVINSAINVVAQLLASVLWAGGRAKQVADATRLSTVTGLALIVVCSALHQLLLAALCTIVIQLILVPSLWRHLRRLWAEEAVTAGRPA